MKPTPKQVVKAKPEKSFEVQFSESLKSAKPITKRNFSDFKVAILNKSQRKAFDIVKQHLENYKRGSQKQLLLICVGPPGCGKSYWLHCVHQLLFQHKVKFVTCAYTASASSLVYGSTFHKTFGLSLNYRATPPDQYSQFVEQSLKGVDWFFFDECSTLGTYLNGFIGERLCAIRGNQEAYGNANVILTGDWRQLFCVGERGLYKTDTTKGTEWAPLDIKGSELYQRFNKCVIFKEQMRQSKDDRFAGLLDRIRNSQVTDQDFELLSARHIYNLTPAELTKFASPNTTFLFPERKQCDRYNNFRVKHLGQKIHEIFPKDSKGAPKEITQRDVLLLSIGAKVILNYNLSPQVGLYNSALGEVIEIVEPTNGNKYHEIIIVSFPSYTGPVYNFKPKQVPILRRKTQEVDPISGATWSRSFFGLSLGFAITIHRCMGMTLERVSIATPPLGEDKRSMFRSLSPMLLYTSLSRVRSFDSAVFQHAPQRRFMENPNGEHFRGVTAEMERLVAIENSMSDDV